VPRLFRLKVLRGRVAPA